jgi:hypothetical protein
MKPLSTEAAYVGNSLFVRPMTLFRSQRTNRNSANQRRALPNDWLPIRRTRGAATSLGMGCGDSVAIVASPSMRIAPERLS